MIQVPSSGGVAGQNVVIRQNGLRPGQPGTSITVPLATLQSLQAGQGIPTGQPGHLLVRTETGQYQILRVGPQPSSTPQQQQQQPGGPTVVTSSFALHSQPQPQQPTVVRTVTSTIGPPGPGSVISSNMMVRQNGPINPGPGPGPQIVRPMTSSYPIGGAGINNSSAPGVVANNTIVRNTLTSAPSSTPPLSQAPVTGPASAR